MRGLNSPIKAKQPLRELNGQENNQAGMGKRKMTLRDKEMEEVGTENQNLKKAKSTKLVEIREPLKVKVWSFPDGAPKDI